MAIERDLLVLVEEALHKTEVAPSGRRDIVGGDYPSKAKNMKSVPFTYRYPCAIHPLPLFVTIRVTKTHRYFQK
jgi:hypothetical protein